MEASEPEPEPEAEPEPEPVDTAEVSTNWNNEYETTTCCVWTPSLSTCKIRFLLEVRLRLAFCSKNDFKYSLWVFMGLLFQVIEEDPEVLEEELPLVEEEEEEEVCPEC